LPKKKDFTTSPSPHKKTIEPIQNLHQIKKLALKTKKKTKEKDLATNNPKSLTRATSSKKSKKKEIKKK